MENFQKTFSELLLPNKDYKVVINYAYGCSAEFIYYYNSISNTYMGLKADCFIDSLRGLLSVCPHFLNAEGDYRKELKNLGFKKVEMDKKTADLYLLMAELKLS